MADLPSSVNAADVLGTLARALLRGNVTGGTDIEISDGDRVRGFDGNTGTDLILQGGNSSLIAVDGGNIQLRGGIPGSGAEPGVIQMTNGGGDDTKPVFSFQSEGANGATIHVFAGSRDPEASSIVPISTGDLYIRSDGRIYHNSAGGWLISNAGWSAHRTVTANHTADLADATIFADATSGNLTVTLPTAVGVAGKEYKISKRDASANTVTIDPDGSETINGDTEVIITTQYDSVTVESDGTEWGIT